MAFQWFSRTCLDVLLVPFFDIFISSFSVWPVVFCLNLNEELLPGKLSIMPASIKVALLL